MVVLRWILAVAGLGVSAYGGYQCVMSDSLSFASDGKGVVMPARFWQITAMPLAGTILLVVSRNWLFVLPVMLAVAIHAWLAWAMQHRLEHYSGILGATILDWLGRLAIVGGGSLFLTFLSTHSRSAWSWQLPLWAVALSLSALVLNLLLWFAARAIARSSAVARE